MQKFMFFNISRRSFLIFIFLIQLQLGLIIPVTFAQSNAELEQMYKSASESIDQGKFDPILKKLLLWDYSIVIQ